MTVVSMVAVTVAVVFMVMVVFVVMCHRSSFHGLGSKESHPIGSNKEGRSRIG
jgi:preprotein translocase subunit SecG